MSIGSIFCAKIKKICADVSDGRYSKRVRRKVRNRDFSIICPNCIGGVIYHRLGMEFLSPTVNLWMSQPDFIRFATNLKAYLDEELVFLSDEAPYPIGMLGDVKIHFNHYKSEEQARTAWERRKARVRFDNLYLIMYERDGVTGEDLRKFGAIPCKNRIVLSEHQHPDIPYVKTMTPNNTVNGPQFLDKDWRNRRTFEKKWDFVKWLNSQEELSYHEKNKGNQSA